MEGQLRDYTMTLDRFRPVFAGPISRLAKIFADTGITPNQVTLASLLFSAAAGLCYALGAANIILIGAALIFVVLNSLFDALDGSMARYLLINDKAGDFLDHVVDRYADVFIVGGLIFGGYAGWGIGLFTMVGILLTSYLGTQAQALSIGRFYGGIMGRADRLVLIMAASLLHIIYPQAIFGYTLLGWSLILMGIASHVTALQRIHFIRTRLG